MKRAEPSNLTRAAAIPVPDARAGRLRLSCVVPAWNEADSLGPLLLQLEPVLAACADEWEIVLVDDGSTDATQQLFDAWERRPGLHMLTLSRNFGKEAALMAGLAAAQGDVVITMDADLQHPPALIERFVTHWRAGAEVVYAVRADRRDESRFKRWGTHLFYKLVNGTGRFDVPEDAGDFRLMDRRVVDALLALPERNRFMKGLYAWVGFRSVAVPYEVAPRQHGASHFGARQLFKLSLVGLTAFTTWPLRAVSFVGIVLAMLAFGYGL
ncbi:MAG: glycosyltransferase family 2 protein, partial [Aquincola sp.]|nr:glycosyltransferase family 2 protein [Aquincola sp.]